MGIDCGKAPGYTSIKALAWTEENCAVIHLYWTDARHLILQTQNTGSWATVSKVVGPVRPGAQIAAAQWNKGKQLSVFYQSDDNSIVEISGDGHEWADGAIVAAAH